MRDIGFIATSFMGERQRRRGLEGAPKAVRWRRKAALLQRQLLPVEHRGLAGLPRRR